LIYVENPKAGSTSIHALFLQLAGIDSPLGARATYDAPSCAGTLADAGLERFTLQASALPTFRAENSSAFWFSVVRHPYARAISNYHNKLSRYARRFEPSIYWRGKLRQILEGPGAWGTHTHGIRHMQRSLNFEQFVAGLERHGIDFDIHFRLQSRQLHVDRIEYDEVFKLVDYEPGMRSVLEAVGVADPDRLLGTTGHLNATPYADAKGSLLTPPAAAALQRMYAADFDAFGYTP